MGVTGDGRRVEWVPVRGAVFGLRNTMGADRGLEDAVLDWLGMSALGRLSAGWFRFSDAAAVRWLQALQQGRRGDLAQGGDRRSRPSMHRT